jgi:hypothetical protein
VDDGLKGSFVTHFPVDPIDSVPQEAELPVEANPTIGEFDAAIRIVRRTPHSQPVNFR